MTPPAEGSGGAQRLTLLSLALNALVLAAWAGGVTKRREGTEQQSRPGAPAHYSAGGVPLHGWRTFAVGRWVPDANNRSVHLRRWVPLYPPAPRPASAPRAAVLIIGDSVDNHIVKSGCEAWGVAPEWEWAREFPYTNAAGMPGSVRCAHAAWGSAAFVHHFGAAPRHPYAGPPRDPSPADRFVDTAVRIPRAIEHYKRTFGAAPTHVLYQSALWDHLKLAGSEEALQAGWADALRNYSTHLAHNFAMLRRLLPDATLLTRTTPVSEFKDGAYMFNNALRVVAAGARVPLLDFDAMTSFEKGHGNLFLDRHHPHAWATAGFFTSLMLHANSGQQPPPAASLRVGAVEGGDEPLPYPPEAFRPEASASPYPVNGE